MKGMLLKHQKPTRIFHWINLIVFLLLFCSGMPMLNKNLQFLAALFGGLENAALCHKYLGFFYILAPLVYIVLYFDLFKKFLATISSFDQDDRQWLRVAGGYLAPLIKGEVPPQGKYNAGQKLLAWIVIVFSCVLAASGLVMIFYEQFPPRLVRWLSFVHAFAAVFLSCGVIVHFYLAAINPSSRGELKTMLGNGYIEEDLARRHNLKWYKEMTAGQREE